MAEFKAIYPKERREVYEYAYALSQYQERHKDLSAETVYRSVMKVLSDTIRQRFIDWAGTINRPLTLQSLIVHVITQFNARVSRFELEGWVADRSKQAGRLLSQS